MDGDTLDGGTTRVRIVGDRALIGLIPPVGVIGSGDGGPVEACDEPRSACPRVPPTGVGVSGVLGKSRSKQFAETLPRERAMLEYFEGKDGVEEEEGMTGGFDLVALCLDGVSSMKGSLKSGLSRREPRRIGELISRRVLAFLVCSRTGETSAATLEVDDTGTADWDFGEGMA